jgi:hypothetical protein
MKHAHIGTAGNAADEKRQLVDATNWRAVLGSAAYFSLLSAVNIGFEQFTPGDWIRRLQTREYSLEAIGWVRVVAGCIFRGLRHLNSTFSCRITPTDAWHRPIRLVFGR